MLPEGVSESIQNEAILLGTLGASLLRNFLAGKGINRAGAGAIAKSVSEETK